MNGAATAARPTLTDAVDVLLKEAHELSQRVDVLEERVQAVTVPPPPSPTGNGPDGPIPEPPARSRIGHTMEEATNLLRTLQGRVAVITANLEL